METDFGTTEWSRRTLIANDWELIEEDQDISEVLNDMTRRVVPIFSDKYLRQMCSESRTSISQNLVSWIPLGFIIREEQHQCVDMDCTLARVWFFWNPQLRALRIVYVKVFSDPCTPTPPHARTFATYATAVASTVDKLEVEVGFVLAQMSITNLNKAIDYVVRTAMNQDDSATVMRLYFDEECGAVTKIRRLTTMENAKDVFRKYKNYGIMSTINSTLEEEYPEIDPREMDRSQFGVIWRDFHRRLGSRITPCMVWDDRHLGLPLGAYRHHTHNCYLCENVFEHRHRIRDSAAMSFLRGGFTLCRDCKKKHNQMKVQNPYTSSLAAQWQREKDLPYTLMIFSYRQMFIEEFNLRKINRIVYERAMQKLCTIVQQQKDQDWMGEFANSCLFNSPFFDERLFNTQFCSLVGMFPVHAPFGTTIADAEHMAEILEDLSDCEQQGLGDTVFGSTKLNETLDKLNIFLDRISQQQANTERNLSDFTKGMGFVGRAVQNPIVYGPVIAVAAFAAVTFIYIRLYTARMTHQAFKQTTEMYQKMSDLLGELEIQTSGSEQVTEMLRNLDQKQKDTSDSFRNSIRSILEAIGRIFHMPIDLAKFLVKKAGTFTAVCVALTQFKNGLVALETLLDKVATCIESFLSWMLKRSIKLTKSRRDRSTFIVRAALAVKVLNFFSDHSANDILMSPVKRASFMGAFLYLHNNGKEFLTAKRGDFLAQAAHRALERASPIYSNLFEAEKPNEKYSPFGVYFYGTPGVGKTFLCTKVLPKYFQERIKRDHKIEIPDTSLVYTRNASDEYWSRYAHQFITYFDDMYQLRDSKDFADLFSAYGPNPHLLNMADLREKGRSFSSRVIFMSSNQAFPRPVEVSEPRALYRRRDFLIHLERNERYRNDEFENVCNNDDFWIFHVKNPTDPADMGRDLQTFRSVQEFQRFVYDRFIEKHQMRYPQNEFPIVRPEQSGFIEDGFLISADTLGEEFITLYGEKTWFALPGAEVNHVVIDDIINIGGRIYHFNEGENPAVPATFAEFLGEKLISWEDFSKRLSKILGVDRKDSDGKLESWISALTIVVGALGVIGLGWLVRAAYKWLFAPTMDEQSAPGKKIKIPRTRPSVKVPPRSMKITGSGQALTMDENSAQVVNAVMANLLYVETEAGVRVANAIAIGGANVLVNEHLITTWLEKSGVLYLRNPSQKIRWTVDLKETPRVQLGNSLASVLIMRQKTFPIHKDIRKHILSSNDDMEPMSSANGEEKYPAFKTRMVQNAIHTESTTATFVPAGDFKGEISPWWMTPITTVLGDCGSPVFVKLANGLVKCCGIHEVGRQDLDRSFGTPIWREHFESNSDLDLWFPADYAHIQEYGLEESEAQSGNYPETIHLLGSPNPVNHQPIKTDFQQSVLFGVFGDVQTEPAVLNVRQSEERGNGSDPYQNALQKYVVSPYVSANYKSVQRAVPELAAFFRSFPRYTDYARVLTFKQALNGSVLPYENHLDLSTSAGYPWKFSVKKKGKGDYLEICDDKIVLTEKGALIEEAVKERIEQARLGFGYPTYGMDCLKDECLPSEKVEISKTRLFCSLPMDHTLALRMYTLGFVAHSMYNGIANFTGPGVAESYADWHYLGLKLSKFNFFLCGDFKNWDKSLSTELLVLGCEVMNLWYLDGNDRIRHALFEDLYHTVVIGQGVAYSKHQGSPSGCAVTTPLNNIVQLLLIRACYIEVCEANNLYSEIPWNRFVKNIYCVTYGDDHVIAVSDEFVQYFDMFVLEKFYKKFGINYTDTSKTCVNVPYFNFEDMTFLKRHFVLYKDHYLGVKPLQDVLEIVNWSRKGNQRTWLEQTLSSFLMELWKHGQEIYDRYVKILIECLANEENLGFVFPSWKDMEQTWFRKTRAMQRDDDLGHRSIWVKPNLF